MILISNMDLCQSCIENTKRDSILNALIYTDVLNMDLCQSYIENTKCHCNSVLDTWIYAYIYLCI